MSEVTMALSLKLLECSKLRLSTSQVAVDASVTMQYLISQVYLGSRDFRSICRVS